MNYKERYVDISFSDEYIYSHETMIRYTTKILSLVASIHFLPFPWKFVCLL